MDRRVLIIPTGGLRREGITSSILTFMRFMDRSGLDIRVAAVYNNEPDVLSEFKSLGCAIVETPDRRSETTEYARFLFSYMRRERIDVVHVHGSSSVMAIELRLAQLAGVKERIAHSRNTKSDDSRRDRVLRPLFRHSWTRALACGEDAGKWLFEDSHYEVLHNGHDLSGLAFDPLKRMSMRARLALKDEPTIGFVGNINYVKNQTFLIQVFDAISRKMPNARLFIIGDGPDRSKIEAIIQEKKLGSRVVITGRISNVNDYLQAMDVMMLPSLFEGLPNVVLEWQASGLPCIVSDVVTRECAVAKLVRFVSLDRGAEYWANCACGFFESTETDCNGRCEASESACRSLRSHGFDIKNASARLREIYLGE